jgi:CDP-6-deoxy-D-xylo-4-hexulose-3-dehydrase
MEYDDMFIFDEVGWNFEPNEVSAAFGRVQLRKLPDNLAARQRNFDRLAERFAKHPEVFTLPRQTADLVTGWHMFPFLVRPESGVRRADFQDFMESHGIDTRMVWTGNVARQPAFKRVPHRVDPQGLPNADRVMEQGLILPCNHAMTDADIDYVNDLAELYLSSLA